MDHLVAVRASLEKLIGGKVEPSQQGGDEYRADESACNEDRCGGLHHLEEADSHRDMDEVQRIASAPQGPQQGHFRKAAIPIKGDEAQHQRCRTGTQLDGGVRVRKGAHGRQ